MKDNSRNRYFFEEASLKEILPGFVLPAMLGMVVVFLYNFADTYFVAQMDSPELVAALSITMPVFMIFMGLGNIFGIGCGTAISRYLGKARPEKVNKMASLSFSGCLAAGVIFSILCLFLLDPLLHAIGATEDTYRACHDYGIVLVAGGAVIMTSISMSHVVRSMGEARKAMQGLFLGTIGNIVLDPLFIFYFDLGIRGAAYATILANFLTILYYLRCYYHRVPASLRPGAWCWRRQIFAEMLGIGIPAFLTNLLILLSTVALNRCAVPYGSIAVAIFGIAIKINMLPKFIAMGFARGIQPFIGYNYGVGNGARMQYLVRKSLVAGCTLCLGLTLVLFIFSRSLLGMLMDDPVVIEWGTPILRITIISGIFFGVIQLAASVFQGMGKKSLAFLLAVVQGGMFFPVLFFTQMGGSAFWLAVTLPISDFLVVLLCLIAWKRESSSIKRNAP